VLILCVFVLSVLSIYWGVFFRVRENLTSAIIAVVDFDSTLPPYDNVEAIVGPFVQQAIRTELTTAQYPLGYEFFSPQHFNNDPLAVRRAVHQEKYWGAIVVNNNATALLRQAVETGNRTYDPHGAAAVVTNQARDIESETNLPINLYPTADALVRLQPIHHPSSRPPRCRHQIRLRQ
jgi:hypothetical protein